METSPTTLALEVPPAETALATHRLLPAYRAQLRTVRRKAVLFLAGALVLLITGWRSATAFGATIIVLGLTIETWMLQTKRKSLRRLVPAVTASDHGHPWSVSFSDDGVRSVCEWSDVRLGWPCFDGYIQDAEGLALVYRGGQALLWIPARDFGADGWGAISPILSAHLATLP